MVGAANGDQGLSRARTEHPDLVILDIVMSSVLDGDSVSDTIRENEDL